MVGIGGGYRGSHLLLLLPPPPVYMLQVIKSELNIFFSSISVLVKKYTSKLCGELSDPVKKFQPGTELVSTYSSTSFEFDFR